MSTSIISVLRLPVSASRKAKRTLLSAGLFLASCLFPLLLTSCHSDDSDDPSEQRNCTNTVFIYMPWTGSQSSSYGSLTKVIQQNIHDIQTETKNGNSDKATRTIVLFADTTVHSTLFEIKGDGTTRKIEEYPHGYITTTAALRTLLNKVAAYSPTATYSMLIGSHGNGWLPAGSQPAESRAFGGTSAATQMEVDTLADAITSSKIGKMQYVCFDDCYMASIETAYSLRNATNWLVASTSEVMDIGLPYSTVWRYLSSTNVDYSKVIDAFGAFYTNYDYPYGALAAIDCSKTDKMAELMKALNKKYEGWDYDLSTIQALDGFRSHVYYDMGAYINTLCGNDTTGNQQVYNELKSLVPYKFTTPSLYTVYQGGYSYKVRTFSGISTSDPTENASAMNIKKKTKWWKATH